MEELIHRLLDGLNNYISELEKIDNECRATLAEATQQKNYPENDIAMLTTFARDNHRRLQFALAERDLINQY